MLFEGWERVCSKGDLIIYTLFWISCCHIVVPLLVFSLHTLVVHCLSNIDPLPKEPSRFTITQPKSINTYSREQHSHIIPRTQRVRRDIRPERRKAERERREERRGAVVPVVDEP